MWIPFAIAAAILIPVVLVVRAGWKRHQEEKKTLAAQKVFRERREWLEAQFVTIASQNSKPRGLRWHDCEFDDDVAFARERASGHIRALVGITIKFEAIEDGGMEHVEAVDNHKAATAVFRFDGKGWDTEGRAVFNLSPSETIEHFVHDLEPLLND